MYSALDGNLEPFVTFYCEEVRSNRLDGIYTYGVVDPWGRAVGCEITTWESSYVIEEGVSTWSYDQRNKTLDLANERLAYCVERGPFALWAQQTRGGKTYGASQSPRYFKTREARDAAVVKYLKQGRATAEKSVAKQAAKRAARA